LIQINARPSASITVVAIVPRQPQRARTFLFRLRECDPERHWEKVTGDAQPPAGMAVGGANETGAEVQQGDGAMLQTLVVVVLVLVLLSFFGGYSGYMPSHYGYGGGGLGLVILIVLLVLLLR
jgi:hypothetical protein